MQKLFSMFPRGAPGLALLLLRLFVSAVMVCEAVAAAPVQGVILVGMQLACAAAVLAGLITPVASVLAALVETSRMDTHSIEAALHSLAPMIIAIALTPLGPGAYSIDARLFGRRLVEFGPQADDGPPEVDR